MAFTSAELDNIANAALDYYIKGQPLSQTIQDKPLLTAMRENMRNFSGGAGEVRRNVKGEYSTSFTGYTHDDTVAYGTPANIKQVAYAWKEMHAGIQITHTELKRDGIEVIEGRGASDTSQISGNEMHRISSLLEDKLEDMDEGMKRSLNEIFWLDGTQDAKVFPGVMNFIADDPSSGTVGGLSRASNSWWRNRELTAAGSGAIAPSVSNQTLTKTLRAEVRQLRRYGGRPSLVLAGSAFIEALEAEVHEKGSYTDAGFANAGTTDIGMADIRMRGVGRIIYDPTLDDESRSKYCYFIDPRRLRHYVLTGHDMKKWSPHRPAEKYVLYRGVTHTGVLVADQLNCHGVYEITAVP
jgi:hypothetical protein